MTPYKRRLAVGFMTVLLSGCGLQTPEIKEAWDGNGIPAKPEIKRPPFSATAQIEFEIRKKIYCELRTAVVNVNAVPLTASNDANTVSRTRLMIPKDWIAQISLSLQVDEMSALSPGVAWNDVMRNAAATFGVGTAPVTFGQSFNLGFGGTASSTATRIDKFDPIYSIGWLMKKNTNVDICEDKNDIFRNEYPHSSPFLIESELGIEKWLMGAMLTENLLPSQPPIKSSAPPKKKSKGPGVNIPLAATDSGGNDRGGTDKGGGGGGSLGPFSVSTEFKFVIVTNGNITPTWKLLQVTANNSGTLLSAGRTRTHDLIITIGPQGSDTASANFVLQLSSGINNGLRAATAGN